MPLCPIIFARAPVLSPIRDYLIKSNRERQRLFKEDFYPWNGLLTVRVQPGLGLALSEDIITNTRFLAFSLPSPPLASHSPATLREVSDRERKRLSGGRVEIFILRLR